MCLLSFTRDDLSNEATRNLATNNHCDYGINHIHKYEEGAYNNIL